MLKNGKNKQIIYITFFLYLLALFYLVFWWHRGYWRNMSMVEYALFQMNIIPFKTIIEYILAFVDGRMNLAIPIMNLGGNFLMFFPMGVYLPLLFKNIKTWRRYIFIIVGILFGVEVIQFFTKRGALDIDDFILNLLGALLGFAIWRFLSKRKIK